MTRLAAAALAATLAVGAASGARAHDGVAHATPAEAAAHAAATAPTTGPLGPAGPFPTSIGGSFALVDQHGRPRTERDPDGRAQLIFFGYASCPAICGVALPRMAEAVELLKARGLSVRPVLITVDPANDTPEAMRAALPKIHDELIGLTGSAAALATARAAFQVESKRLGETPDGIPIYAHGSFIYLMDAEGGLLTVAPPILGAERLAEIAARHVAGE